MTLEEQLRALQVDWPATPDIATAIAPRLETRERRGQAPYLGRRWPSRRRLAAAALIALTGLTAAIEPARSAVLEFLGLRSVRIERRAPEATPAPRPAGSLGEDLGLGDAMTLAQAHRAVDFGAAPPAVLGEPDAVYVDAGRISYVYRARPGLPPSGPSGVAALVTELRAVVTPLIEKAAGPETKVERLRIDGAPAYFLSGGPHGFAYAETEGSDIVFEQQRLAGNTLLVERDGLLLRIEAEVGRARAVEIARSITATSGAPSGS